MLGTALALCVYYRHYGRDFTEGDLDPSPVTMVARLVAVVVLVLALRPPRLRVDSAFALTALYCVALASLLAAWLINGSTNDTFFLNTAMQLPILLALSGTRLRIDYPRWFRFIARFVALQAMGDIVIVSTGSALWFSGAFIGGVGNPSSFGLICALMSAFCLLHPEAGRGRRVLGVGLAAAAVMTKSLFAILAVVFLTVVWASRSWRRLVAVAVIACCASISIYYFALGAADNDDPGFIENKVLAAGTLLGFVSYDVNSSGSVGGRLEIHQRTYDALRDEPWRLVLGHLQGKVYWPMDSQVLTYLGSFGIAMLAAFLFIHALWMRRAWLNAGNDGGFGFVALILFTFIFLTNRILDYFPVATMYFLCVMSITSRSGIAFNEPAGTRRRGNGAGVDLTAERKVAVRG